MNGSYGMILIMVVARCEWFVWCDPSHFFFFVMETFFGIETAIQYFLRSIHENLSCVVLLDRTEGRTGNPIPNVSTTRGTRDKAQEHRLELRRLTTLDCITSCDALTTAPQ